MSTLNTMSQIKNALDAPEDQDSPRRMDPELRTLAAILRLLAELPDTARPRVVKYLSDRFEESSGADR